LFRIEGSVGTAAVIMTVPDIARLNECYLMLRCSTTFDNALLTVTRDDGLSVMNRAAKGCPPIWWIGRSPDADGYVRLFPCRPVARDAR
jgi:hypothetical protein